MYVENKFSVIKMYVEKKNISANKKQRRNKRGVNVIDLQQKGVCE